MALAKAMPLVLFPIGNAHIKSVNVNVIIFLSTVAIALGVTAVVALFLGCLIYSAQKKSKIINVLHNINIPVRMPNFSRPSFW